MGKVNKPKETQSQKANPLVWDCESSLYDSFELKSFERQLDSAITSARSLSMPHFFERQAPPPPQAPALSKKYSKISRSLHKFIRSVFRPKQSKYGSMFRVQERSQEGVYVVFDRYGALTTIPEVPENVAADYDAGLSPDIRSLLGRSASDRFTATSIGISCA